MSIIGHFGQDASIEAELPVTAFKLSSTVLSKLMHEIPTLGYNLWFTAAKRFAEEILQYVPKFQEMSQSELRTMIAKGSLVNTQAGQKTKNIHKYSFLLSGKIKDVNSSADLSTPDIIKFEEFDSLTDSKLFVIELDS